MQKHDADGVVWVRREAGGKDEFSHCAWMYETKQLYTPDGQRIDLWMSQFEVSGIVTKEDVPRHKVGEDSTFKMESIFLWRKAVLENYRIPGARGYVRGDP
ncbi:MAG: hypothetical protein ACI4Q0_07070 [Oligosphaeraceae bacterium]